jgi:hypothetical protein
MICLDRSGDHVTFSDDSLTSATFKQHTRFGPTRSLRFWDYFDSNPQLDAPSSWMTQCRCERLTHEAPFNKRLARLLTVSQRGEGLATRYPLPSSKFKVLRSH